MAKFPNHKLAACARREVKQRQRVYPGIWTGKPWERERLENEIAMMQQIAEDYAKLDGDQPDLFEENE